MLFISQRNQVADNQRDSKVLFFSQRNQVADNQKDSKELFFYLRNQVVKICLVTQIVGLCMVNLT